MKKFICVLLLIATMASLLTACGKFTCDWCEQEKTGMQYKLTLEGKEMTVCKECKDEVEDAIEAVADAVGEAADAINGVVDKITN